MVFDTNGAQCPVFLFMQKGDGGVFLSISMRVLVLYHDRAFVIYFREQIADFVNKGDCHECDLHLSGHVSGRYCRSEQEAEFCGDAESGCVFRKRRGVRSRVWRRAAYVADAAVAVYRTADVSVAVQF